METRTRFNLNAAIENWQQELAAQPGLAPEDRRELESHLSDSVAELRQRGLNEEESFWLARRRLGSPQRLSEEFVREDPARVWRKRLFWMALALLTVQLWKLTFRTAFVAITDFERFLPEWVVFYVPFWLQDLCRGAGRGRFILAFGFYLPFVALLVAFARGRLSGQGAATRLFLWNRWRFLCATTVLVLGVHLLNAIVIQRAYQFITSYPLDLYLEAITSMCLVGILSWVLPSQSNAASARVEAN